VVFATVSNLPFHLDLTGEVRANKAWHLLGFFMPIFR
jgi:hypothetical protein